jgi:hypothetical protein
VVVVCGSEVEMGKGVWERKERKEEEKQGNEMMRDQCLSI